MADSKAISQLTTAENTSPSDLFETAIPAPSGVQSSTGYVSRKVSATEMGQLLNNTMLYPNQLETENKTIFGAINELATQTGSGTSCQVEVYTGTATSVVDNGSCVLTKVIYNDYSILQIDGWFKANGRINTSTAQTPLFTFDSGVIDSALDGKAGIFYTIGGTSAYFGRFNFQASTDSFDCFYGTVYDGYFNFSQTFILTN